PRSRSTPVSLHQVCPSIRSLFLVTAGSWFAATGGFRPRARTRARGPRGCTFAGRRTRGSGAPRRRAGAGLPESIAVLSRIFCPVHRAVGVLDQRVDVLSGLRIGTDSDTGGKRALGVLELKRSGGRRQNALHDGGQVRWT